MRHTERHRAKLVSSGGTASRGETEIRARASDGASAVDFSY